MASDRIALDSSAIIAIITREAGYENLSKVIGGAESVIVGAPTLTEVAIVLGRRSGHSVSRPIQSFLASTDTRVVPFDAQHYRVAQHAYLRYGKGRHRAALNFGDCLAYAVAAVADAALLYVGDDFPRTDIESAL